MPDDDYDEDLDCFDMWIVKYRTAMKTLSHAFSKVAVEELHKLTINKNLDVENMSDTELFQLWENNMSEIAKTIETNKDLMRNIYGYWSTEISTYCPSCMPDSAHVLSLLQEKENIVQLLMECDYYKRSIRYPIVLGLRTKSLH